MRRSIIYTIILAIIFFAACSRKPSYVLSQGEMIDVLYDIQLAQSIFRINNDFSSDEKKDAVIEGILKKHNLTQAELDSSLVWYADNLSVYIKINDSVASRLKTNYEKLTAINEGIRLNARDWSKYVIPPFFYLTESTPILSFNVDSVKLGTVDVDKFNVTFDVLGINSNHNVEANVYYTYKDTLVKNQIQIKEDTHIVLRKPELPDSLLKNISGYIRLKDITRGLTTNVLLHNISYSDSLSLDATYEEHSNLEGESRGGSVTRTYENQELPPDREDTLTRNTGELKRNLETRRLRQDSNTVKDRE